MMGLWQPRGAVMSLSSYHRSHFRAVGHNMEEDENSFYHHQDSNNDEFQQFHPPFESHGQPQPQQVIFPTINPQNSNLTQALSFNGSGDTDEAQTPSVFAETRQSDEDSEEDQKPPARHSAFGSSPSFDESNARDFPNGPLLDTAAAAFSHHSTCSNPFSGYDFSPSLSLHARLNQDDNEHDGDDHGEEIAAAGEYPAPAVGSGNKNDNQFGYPPAATAAAAAITSRQQERYAEYSLAPVASVKQKEADGYDDEYLPGQAEDDESAGARTKSARKGTGNTKRTVKKKQGSVKHARPQHQQVPAVATHTLRRSPRVQARARSDPAPVPEPAVFSSLSHKVRGRLFEDNNEAPPAPMSQQAIPAERYFPTELEIGQCPNNRKLTALRNFYDRLNDLAVFKSIHGHCDVPQQYHENKQLGVWVNKTRMEKKKFDLGKKSSLTEERIANLVRVGFNWGTDKGEAKWQEHYENLLAYRQEHGHTNVPTKYPRNPALGRFVSTQRCEYKKFQRGEASLVNQEKITLLENVGFCWDMLNS